MEDTRRLGKSYGYVIVPEPGMMVAGVKFQPGPRAAGKGDGGGWYRLLVDAGCQVITQAEYEDELQHAGQSPAQPVATGRETKDDRTGHNGSDPAAPRTRKPQRGSVRNGRRAPARDRGASAGTDGVSPN